MIKNKFKHLPVILLAILQMLLIIPGINIVFFLFIDILISAFLVVFILIAYIIPARRLEKENRIICDTDLKNLSIAVSEFSRGNISFGIPPSAPAEIVSSRISSLKGIETATAGIQSAVSEIINEFRSISAIPCKRVYYIGADSYLEGQKCGEVFGKILDGRGQIAILVFSLTNTGQYLRRKGFLNTINSRFPDIEIVKIAEDKRDENLTMEITRNLISMYPELSGIYVASGKSPSAVAKTLVESGKAGKIKVICHDLTENTVKAIKSGTITAALSQNPYIQGHDPVILMANYLFNKKEPLVKRRLTLLETVTCENITDFWDDRQGWKMSAKTLGILAEPDADAAVNNCRIAVILPSRINFWQPVYEGAAAAAKKISAFGFETGIEIPESIASGNFSAQTFRKEMDKLISGGYSAFCLPHFDTELTPYINELSERNIPAITLNSEPVNFRGMLEGVYKHTQHLYAASESLAASSTQTSQATNQITKTMKLITESTGKQADQINETREQIGILAGNISEIAENSGQNEETARQTKDRAETSAEVLRQSNVSLEQTRRMIFETSELTNALGNNSNKISEIITFIDDLASQTRLIAMNAAILAARAGSSGKGFSVLASEITQLSEKSNASTTMISDLIRETLKGIETINSKIMDEVEIIKTAIESADKSEESLNDIIAAAETNITSNSAINMAISRLKEFSVNIRTAVENLEKINQENNKAIRQISGSTEEMSLQVQENNKVAIDLSSLAESQENMVSQFVVGDSGNENSGK